MQCQTLQEMGEATYLVYSHGNDARTARWVVNNLGIVGSELSMPNPLDG